MNRPKISVIVSAFNNADVLPRAIDSVRIDRGEDLEIVVVDDGSSDATSRVADAIAREDNRVRAFRLEQNRGCGGAYNFAIENARGDWLAVLDADDWYEPHRLRRLLQAAEAVGADLVCDELQLFDVGLQKVIERTNFTGGARLRNISASFLFKNDTTLLRHRLGYVKLMYRRAFIGAHQIRYDEAHRIGQDFVFLAELLLSGAKAVIVPEALYVYCLRRGPVSQAFSPHARATGRSSLVVQGCDELLQKYGGAMSDVERSLLIRRKELLLLDQVYLDAEKSLREGRIVEGFKKIALNPKIWPFPFKTVADRLHYASLARRLARR